MKAKTSLRGQAGPAHGSAWRMVAVQAALVAVMWLATRPYFGIIHDSQLYAVQAMHRLDPARFSSDLYFLFGSQDRYSGISALYAPVVMALGAGGAHLALLAAGSVMWLAALAFLLGRLFENWREAAVSALCVCAMVPVYRFSTLQYGEPFFTPRLVVEAMTMAAIGFACRETRASRVVAFGILIAAAAIHPLMAVPGFAVVALVSLARLHRIVTAGAVGLGIVAVLGLAGVEPFVRLMQTMDAEWLGIVEMRAQQAFVENWPWQSGLFLVLPLLSLGLVARLGAGAPRRLARAVPVVGFGLVAVSWLGGDRLGNILVLNLQLWRGVWIVVLLGNALAPTAFRLLPVDSKARFLFLAAIGANVVEARLGIGMIPFASGLTGLACVLVLLSGNKRASAMQRSAGFGASALVAVASLLLPATIAGALWGVSLSGVIDVAQRCVIVGLAALTILALAKRPAQRVGLIAMVAAGLSLWAGMIWDQRDDRMRLVTGTAPIDGRFAAALSGRSVYWEDGVRLLWFRLRQPSYYSCYQGAGVMFFRETAMEHARRSTVLRQLDTADFDVKPDGNCPPRLNPDREGPATRKGVEAVCRALPDLDAMVLYADLPDAPHLRWQPGFDLPVPGQKAAKPAGDAPQGSYNLYDCKDFR